MPKDTAKRATALTTKATLESSAITARDAGDHELYKALRLAAKEINQFVAKSGL